MASASSMLPKELFEPYVAPEAVKSVSNPPSSLSKLLKARNAIVNSKRGRLSRLLEHEATLPLSGAVVLPLAVSMIAALIAGAVGGSPLYAAFGFGVGSLFLGVVGSMAFIDHIENFVDWVSERPDKTVKVFDRALASQLSTESFTVKPDAIEILLSGGLLIVTERKVRRVFELREENGIVRLAELS